MFFFFNLTKFVINHNINDSNEHSFPGIYTSLEAHISPANVQYHIEIKLMISYVFYFRLLYCAMKFNKIYITLI